VCGMICSLGHFALAKLTTVENLNKRTKAWQLAVYITDREKPPTMGVTGTPYATVTYPLPLASEKVEHKSSSIRHDKRTTSSAQKQLHCLYLSLACPPYR
jgi:hypothetical protein